MKSVFLCVLSIVKNEEKGDCTYCFSKYVCIHYVGAGVVEGGLAAIDEELDGSSVTRLIRYKSTKKLTI